MVDIGNAGICDLFDRIRVQFSRGLAQRLFRSPVETTLVRLFDADRVRPRLDTPRSGVPQHRVAGRLTTPRSGVSCGRQPDGATAKGGQSTWQGVGIDLKGVQARLARDVDIRYGNGLLKAESAGWPRLRSRIHTHRLEGCPAVPRPAAGGSRHRGLPRLGPSGGHGCQPARRTRSWSWASVEECLWTPPRTSLSGKGCHSSSCLPLCRQGP